MVTVFCGYDAREAVGFHVFCHSMIKRASRPVRIIPLASMGLPEGSNSFTTSRFLVPWLCGFEGHAIFVDACDMLMLGDVARLDQQFDGVSAVQVVKHPDYTSAHDRKYVGTPMECEQTNYQRKNWASVCIFNAAHEAWEDMDERNVSRCSALDLLKFDHLKDDEIGEIPPEWNVLIDEGQERAGAKILHWTAGIPTFKHYRNARASKDWFDEFEAMTGAMQHG